MPLFHRLRTATVIGLMAVAVAACDSAEERAEGHYESALSLVQEGDTERALVELRNVFRLAPDHEEAQALFADVLVSQNRLREALGTYIALAEAHPQNAEYVLDAGIYSARLAAWDQVSTMLELAQAAAPDDIRTEALSVIDRYRDASVSSDSAAQRAAAADAEALLDDLPDNLTLRQVVLGQQIADGDLQGALASVDEAIRIDPTNEEAYRTKLGVLNEMNDEAAMEETIRAMGEQFPDSDSVRQLELSFYSSRQDFESAEAVLRRDIEEGVADNDSRVTLIEFLRQTSGTDAALEQIDRFIEEGTNDLLFQGLANAIRFDQGERASAIANLDRLVTEAEPSDTRNDMRAILARFLLAEQNEVGARAQVDAILDDDPNHVDAIKMRANWLIEEDRGDDAIFALRRALDSAPTDTDLMTLMAQAYIRNGDRRLARDFLAQAVETSGNARDESLRYAAMLTEDESLDTAELVLIDALRARPDDPQILAALGRNHVARGDWGRAQQVEERLRNLGGEANTNIANELRVAILSGQDDAEGALQFLEGLSAEGDNVAADMALVRGNLSRGDLDAARTQLDQALERSPDSLTLRMANAGITASEGDVEDAIDLYRAIVEDEPTYQQGWITLIRFLNATGRGDAADAALDDALAAIPDGRDLLWAQASNAEQSGNLEEAIEIYERLYEEDTSSLIVANNLASLLSTYRDDPESQERAYNVGRRLRGSDVPAFSDTYGWIMYQRGSYQEALTHLERAAQGLPQDPVVQYHLAETYAALERSDDAVETYQAALDLDPEFAFADEARSQVEQLTSDDDAADAAPAEDAQGTQNAGTAPATETAQ